MRKRIFPLFFTIQHPWRRLGSGLMVGAVVAGLTTIALWYNWLSGVRVRFQDALYRPRPTTDLVTIIAADDASLAAYGRSTTEWDRSVYVDLIAFLDEAGARVIAFDLLFANPSEADANLAAAMRASRKIVQPVVGLYDAHFPTRDEDGGLVSYLDYSYPVPDLAGAAVGLGHVNVLPDDDSFVRRVPLLVAGDEALHPALGMAAYLEYLRILPEMVEVDDDANEVQFAGRTIPTDASGQMLIYFFGPPSHANEPGTFPVVSLVDVLEGRVPPEAFEDRIVLVGALDATALPDKFPTPSTDRFEEMYGVEIHANVIETLHQSLPSFQGKIDWRLNLGLFELPLYEGTTTFPLRQQSLNAAIFVVVALALFSGVALPFLRWYVGILYVLVAYGVYFFWASWSFTVDSKVVELLFPAWSLGLTYLGTIILVYLFEERRRNQINDLFSRYVSPEIAQRIVEQFDRGTLELGGEERELTILFADVRGFTPLAEGLPPTEVVRLLNVFLEEMSAIVMRHGGAIDKYMGDNLMAFWNAPYTQADHAWLATQAGLEMLDAIRRLNEVQQFSTEVQFGIGINTGPVVVGNIGSQSRLEYTPIGDTVNVAARLCGIAPGGACYVGQRTHDLLAGRAQPVAAHDLQLKGKKDEVTVFELRPGKSAVE